VDAFFFASTCPLQRRGLKKELTKSAAKVLSFGEDLGEADTAWHCYCTSIVSTKNKKT
jgi:hypothetical protein